MGNEARTGRPAITDALVSEIVDSAETCERSVLRRLLNLPVRGRAGARVDREIAVRLLGEARTG
jgi:hypothetical protein